MRTTQKTTMTQVNALSPMLLQVFFKDGSSTEKVAVEYPIGHKRRREEGIPVLEEKFRDSLATRFIESRCDEIFELCDDQSQLEQTPVNEFMDLFMVN